MSDEIVRVEPDILQWKLLPEELWDQILKNSFDYINTCVKRGWFKDAELWKVAITNLLAFVWVDIRKHLQENYVQVSNLEANYLLFCLDRYVQTDINGKIVDQPIDGYTKEEIQTLRDRLFAAHDHPEDDDENRNEDLVSD